MHSPYDVWMFEVVELLQRCDLSHRAHRRPEFFCVRRDPDLLESDEASILEVAGLIHRAIRPVADECHLLVALGHIVMTRVHHRRRHRVITSLVSVSVGARLRLQANTIFGDQGVYVQKWKF